MSGTKLPTINVIEIVGVNNILGLASFMDNEEGNKAAKERFKQLCIENTGEFHKDWEKEGLCECHGWKALLIHSTN